MSVRIFLPEPLHKLAGGQVEHLLEAPTVGDALDALCRKFEALRPRIFQEDGTVNNFVNVFANAQHIRFQNGLETPVDGGDEIMIIRSVAGG